MRLLGTTLGLAVVAWLGTGCDQETPGIPPDTGMEPDVLTDLGVETDAGDVGVEPGECPPPPPEGPDNPDRPAQVGAPGCLGGEFFVETAESLEQPCDAFAVELQGTLQANFAPELCRWFPGEHCVRTCQTSDAGVAPGYRPAPGWEFHTLVEAALPVDRNGPPQSGRFFRVRFELVRDNPGNPSVLSDIDGREHRPVDFPDYSMCEVLTGLRASVDAALNSGCGGEASVDPGAMVCGQPLSMGHRLRIGRECPLVPTEVAAVADGPMLTWHTARIGLLPPPATPPAPLPVEIALIDTGVDGALAEPGTGLGIRRFLQGPLTAFPDPDERHRHGSAMALLLAQASPGATITSIRALDKNGYGSTASLARAIDAALYDLPPMPAGPAGPVPLVVNLSVGWPAELSQPRQVRGFQWTVDPVSGEWKDGRACSVIEDGIGESVKYTLAVARRDVTRPVLVVGAAGNRPPGMDNNWTEGINRLLGAMDCENGPPGLSEQDNATLREAWCQGRDRQFPAHFFYPALWGAAPTSYSPFDRLCQPLRSVLPVSAIDDLDRVAVTDPDAPQASLVAPAERVYANVPAWAAMPTPSPFPAPPLGPQCVGERGGSGELMLPRAFTGTSVAAALASGVAANAQVAWMLTDPGTPRVALAARALSRLLYLTGVEIAPARTSVDGVPVRRISDCRVRQMLKGRPACRERLESCVKAGEDTHVEGFSEADPVIDTAVGACAALVQTDCSEEILACRDLPMPAGSEWPPVAWPAGYPPGSPMFEACDTVELVAPVVWGRGMPACPPEGCGSIYDWGKLGPQPQIGGCPDCGLFIMPSGTGLTGTATMVIDIDPTLPANTTFRAPYIYMFKAGAVGRPAPIPVATTTPPCSGCAVMANWKPRTRVDVKNINLPVLSGSDRYTNYKFELRVDMKMPTQTAFTLDKTALTLR